jgi:hypothetical protein
MSNVALHSKVLIPNIEIINVRTKKRRVIKLDNQEKVLYNSTLKDFQLLPPIDPSYHKNSEQPYD